MMASWEDFVGGHLAAGAAPAQRGEQPRIGCYSARRPEYDALGDGAAIVDRSDRGLLEVTGADRAAWLHNLTTNEVKNLSSGEGNYAFVLNLQGRILFDANVLVRPESIWVDLDRRFVATATAHFEKYLIMEDVSVADRTADFVRLGLCGAKARQLLARLGAPHAAVMAWYAVADTVWQGHRVWMFRHNFCGPFGSELLVPSDVAVDFWLAMVENGGSGVVPAGDDAVQIRRIEAGIPWPFHEIVDEYLPAETGQFDRAVSFRKGCYLGQEVVERMRSRGVVARRLVGLTLDEGGLPTPGTAVLSEDDKTAGSVTSVCRSFALGRPIALAYVKAATSSPGTPLRVAADDGACPAVVTALPFVAIHGEASSRS